MEQNGDGKDFGHHLEMAHLHAQSMSHHLQKMKEMHGEEHEGEGQADSGEAAQGDDTDMPQNKAMAFAGKETPEEEAKEDRASKRGRGRRR